MPKKDSLDILSEVNQQLLNLDKKNESELEEVYDILNKMYKKILAQVDVEYNDEDTKIKVMIDKSNSIIQIIKAFFDLKLKKEAFDKYNDLIDVYNDIIELINLDNKVTDEEIDYVIEMGYNIHKLANYVKNNLNEYSDAIILYEKAIFCYDKILEVKKDYEEAWLLKLTAYDNMWRRDEVLKCHYELLRLDFKFSGKNKKLVDNLLNRLKVSDEDVESLMLDYKTVGKADKIIFNYSSVCAFASINPIPFLDIALIFPIQTYMIVKIGQIYGIELDYKMGKALLFQLLGILGFAYIKRQLIKITVPGIAGFINMPIVFGITYGLGKAINAYFYYQSKKVDLTKEQLKSIFTSYRIEGIKFAKVNKNKILKTGEQMKSLLMDSLEKAKVLAGERGEDLKDIVRDGREKSKRFIEKQKNQAIKTGKKIGEETENVKKIVKKGSDSAVKFVKGKAKKGKKNV